MKNKSVPIGLAFALATVIILRINSQRTLGSADIEGTNLRCQIVQSRSIGNIVGIGATEVWFSVINPEGTWIQTQRINIIGQGETKWVQWDAPKSIKTETRNTLSVIPIELRLPSGKIIKDDVVVGIN